MSAAQGIEAVPVVRLARAAARMAPEPAADIGVKAEQSVLGALLIDGAAIDRLNGLRPEHFATAEHRSIFAAILDCAEDDGVIDQTTVAERLRRNGGSNGDGGSLVAYLATLQSNTPSAANVHRYAALVREQAQRRAVAAIGADLVTQANLPGADVATLRRDAEARLASIQSGDAGLPTLDLRALAQREPERPAFIIPDWLPCGYASLLAGHGGVGKSAIALHLAVCIALAHRFFGMDVARRRVLFLSCEDRTDVLHWRLARICRHLGIDLADLAGSLHVADLVGRDAVLWERDPKTGFTVTPAYGLLHHTIRRHQTEVLVVDGIADTFAGNENSRSEVKRYVNAMLSLVPPTGAVLLIGHVAKPAATVGQTGEGYSGSTQWHNAVRARWYLYRETTRGDDGERPSRTGDLILELQKSNLGRMDQEMRFHWDEQAHLFVGESIGRSAFDHKHQDRTEQAGILHAFKACADAGIYVPAAMTGPRTAYLVLSQRPEFPDSLKGSGRAKSRRFWRQVEALRQLRHVAESSIQRKHRHHTATLVLTAEGCAVCA